MVAACFCRWPPLKMGQRAPDNHVLRPGCRLNTVSSLGVCHVSRTDGALTPCHGVFGHRCAYGHVLRPTTLMPAGWTTGRPPFVPLAHLAINIIHPPSSDIGAPRTLTGLNKRLTLALLAHVGMPSDTGAYRHVFGWGYCVQGRPNAPSCSSGTRDRVGKWTVDWMTSRSSSAPHGVYTLVFGRDCCPHAH